jgi:hydroxymethylpyrimidine pyrophosphatase-like HAD family hydrolase
MRRLKQYKAIFFDWDGTAVTSRKASPEPVIGPMKALLQKGVPLVIISGTTYENIAGGKLESYFAPQELQSLFLGLGRGAFNYRYDENGKPVVWKNRVPSKEELLKIHEVCFGIHQRLLGDYDIRTDIVFSRPNYCKIDLMVENDRGESLFMQGGEIEALKRHLEAHGVTGGLRELLALSDMLAQEHGMKLSATCDAKYLEVGPTDKSDNVDDILAMLVEERGIRPEDCAFWGDEYIGADESLFGSDSFMITEKSKAGDFYDVSETDGKRPENVTRIGGGVGAFIGFLRDLQRNLA